MCVLIYVYKECVYHFKLLFSATISNSVVDVCFEILHLLICTELA